MATKTSYLFYSLLRFREKTEKHPQLLEKPIHCEHERVPLKSIKNIYGLNVSSPFHSAQKGQKEFV
jgi:hypothetical protein